VSYFTVNRITLLTECGIYEKWLYFTVLDNMKNNEQYEKEDNQYNVMILKNNRLCGTYYALSIGVTLSFIIFIYELITKYYLYRK
jgi:hypothetical protein